MAATTCWYLAAIAMLDQPMMAMTVRSGICNNTSRGRVGGSG